MMVAVRTSETSFYFNETSRPTDFKQCVCCYNRMLLKNFNICHHHSGDGGCTHLRNVDILQREYTALYIFNVTIGFVFFCVKGFTCSSTCSDLKGTPCCNLYASEVVIVLIMTRAEPVSLNVSKGN
jgi:hypothetical protein